MSSKVKSLVMAPGDVYGELTVIERNTKKEESMPYDCIYWRCSCSCGKKKTVKQDSLRSGKTRSCGHLKKKAWY
jgi:hypothetical protein